MPARPAAQKPPSPRKSQRTRGRVLDAAARLFAKSGYAHTNLSDVAAAAGMKAGSLYYHFDSKEALVEEVLRYGTTHSFDHVKAEVERLGPTARPAEQLRTAIRAHLDSLHTLGDYASAGLRIVDQAPEAIRKRQYAIHRRYGDYWHGLLERAQSAGLLAPNLDLLLARLLLFGAMNGSVDWPASARRSTEDVTSALLALIGVGAG
jgi:AcrR family transcriptional regulator